MFPDEDSDDFDFGGEETKLAPSLHFPSNDIDIVADMGPQQFLSLGDMSHTAASGGRAKKQTDYDGYDVGYDGGDGEGEGGEGGEGGGDGADPEYAGYDEGEGGDYDYYK